VSSQYGREAGAVSIAVKRALHTLPLCRSTGLPRALCLAGADCIAGRGGTMGFIRWTRLR